MKLIPLLLIMTAMAISVTVISVVVVTQANKIIEQSIIEQVGTR